jgi:undecaprenyl-diphosphatase
VDILQAIILGLVQGLTEFLPISSSAHLVFVPWLFGWRNPVLSSLEFGVALHMGTLLAVLTYFWRDWLGMIQGLLYLARRRMTALSVSPGGEATLPGPVGPARPDLARQGRLAIYILLATIPAVLAGLLLEEPIDAWFHSPDPAQQRVGIVVMAVLMIALAGALFLAERVATHKRDLQDIGLGTAMLVGCAQALALFHGVSRSGSTITAGLFANLKRDVAARFSFLLGTPIIVGAGLKQAYDVLQLGGIPADQQLGFVLGFLASLISGYAAIWFLLRFLRRNTTMPFIVYRVLVGAGLILLVLLGFQGL